MAHMQYARMNQKREEEKNFEEKGGTDGHSSNEGGALEAAVGGFVWDRLLSASVHPQSVHGHPLVGAEKPRHGLRVESRRKLSSVEDCAA